MISTSPSVYVIYSSLRATVTCGQSSLATIGPSFDKKTIGYSSRFLAYGTLSSPDQSCEENVVVDGFHTIDFTSLYYHPITTSVTSKAGCAPYVNPRLSLPAELTNVDPTWKSCEPLFYGAFDPPRILQKAGGLVPPSVDPSPITSEAPKPSTGPSSSPSPAPAVSVGPSISSKAPQTTATQSTPPTVQTPGKAESKAPTVVPPNTSSFATVDTSSPTAVNDSPTGGHNPSDIGEPGKAQQQNNDPSEHNAQGSGISPSPTITRGGTAPDQSKSNPTQGESSALNDQVDAVASQGVTQAPSHANEEEAQSPNPGNNATPGQSQLGSSSAVPPSNGQGSTSHDAAQTYPATGPQPTAPEAHSRLPSIIFLHGNQQASSNGDSTNNEPSVASPTNLASDPNENNPAQVQDHDPIAQELPGGGLAIGSQTFSLGQQAEVQGATISVGRSIIALDGATYTRAYTGGSTALSGTAVAGSDDEEPFTLLLPKKGAAGIASLTATLPKASVSALLSQQSAVLSWSQGSPTYTSADAQNSDNTDGDAGIGAAILQAFDPTGNLPAPVTSAAVAQIGTASREGLSAVTNALIGGAPANVTLASAVQIGTASRGSISAASNSLTGVSKPSSPAPSPFDSAATMLTVVQYLKWLSIGLAVNALGSQGVFCWTEYLFE